VERGTKITWVDKIVITRDEVSKQPRVSVEGLWTGKDRRVISRALHREMRRQAQKIIQMHKQADLKAEPKSVDPIEQKRLAGLKAYWAAKKLKKLEEEKKNVRGQRKQK
jgi:hypothetical protein